MKTYSECITKSDYNNVNLRNLFLDHLQQHEGSELYYTDGSKTEQGVGYAYHNGNRVHAKRIPSIATIYTAELNAILAVIENALTINDNRVNYH